jgi:hypothetical protein
MNIQYINDNNGKATGVFIPIKDWKKITHQHKDLLALVDETEPNKAQILQGIKEAVQEVNLIKAGKLKGINAKDLLNEL